MLRCSMHDVNLSCLPTDSPLPQRSTMTTLALALVPLLFATGSLVWLMTSGAKAQAEADAWAADWAAKHHAKQRGASH